MLELPESGLRELIVNNHRIVYRRTPKAVEVLTVFASLDSAVIRDVDSGEVMPVPGIPVPARGFELSTDRRSVLVNQAVIESDIWLLTLE